MARLPQHGAKMNKVKIGTTIEVDTKAALDGLMQATPDSLGHWRGHRLHRQYRYGAPTKSC